MWPWQWTALHALTVGVWTLLAFAIYDAVVWTIYAVTTRQRAADERDFMDWCDRQLGAIHARLDRLGAPGAHPSSPPPRPTVVMEPAAAAQDAEATTDAVIAGLREAAGMGPRTAPLAAVRPPPSPMDRPHPEQYAAPTRPDFARLVKVPAGQADQPQTAHRGKHRAHT